MCQNKQDSCQIRTTPTCSPSSSPRLADLPPCSNLRLQNERAGGGSRSFLGPGQIAVHKPLHTRRPLHSAAALFWWVHLLFPAHLSFFLFPSSSKCTFLLLTPPLLPAFSLFSESDPVSTPITLSSDSLSLDSPLLPFFPFYPILLLPLPSSTQSNLPPLPSQPLGPGHSQSRHLVPQDDHWLHTEALEGVLSLCCFSLMTFASTRLAATIQNFQ